MRLLRWEKWDAGTVNGSTVRLHLVTGFCCDNGYKVSCHQRRQRIYQNDLFIQMKCYFSVYFLRLFCSRMCLDWRCPLCAFSSFTCPQILLIWGNFVAFYMINLILSTVPSLQLYTITFRLCSQPSYWISMAVSLPNHILYGFGLTPCSFRLTPNDGNVLSLPADGCSRNGTGGGFQVLEEPVSA